MSLEKKSEMPTFHDHRIIDVLGFGESFYIGEHDGGHTFLIKTRCSGYDARNDSPLPSSILEVTFVKINGQETLMPVSYRRAELPKDVRVRILPQFQNSAGINKREYTPEDGPHYNSRLNQINEIIRGS